MQIGIDLGASKIEYVLLDDSGNEHHRERIEVPKDYKNTLEVIKKILIDLEKKAGKELPVGVCHPGIHSIQTGLVKNAPNSFWINGKPLQRDLRAEIGKEIYCENDANCFALSEAIDGSGKHYKIVFGVILGSGVGGGLVIDKRIVNGPNGITGEWGHNQIPSVCIDGIQIKKTNLKMLDFTHDIEIVLKSKKKGYKIKELPVNWIHKKGSKISIFKDSPSLSLSSITDLKLLINLSSIYLTISSKSPFTKLFITI